MRRRVSLKLILAIGWAFATLYAQPDSLVSKIRMNFAVPDAPAFKILRTQPDNILRPSTTQELAISLSEPFLSSKLPSAFAAEFSPYLAIGGSSLSLRDYQESSFKRILYHTRVSLAAQHSGDDSTLVAAGVRFTIMDKSDLRLDKEYIDRVFSFNDSVLAITSRVRDHFRGNIREYRSKPQSERDSIDKLAADSAAVATRMLDESIDSERETARLRNWNKTIIEAGLAIAGASSKSAASGIVGLRAALWVVGAGSIHHWGQWVLGFNATLRRTEGGEFFRVDGSLSSRLYVGANAYKGFVQLELEIVDKAVQNLFQTGGELRLYEIIWADFSAGLEKVQSRKPVLTSSFNLRFGTP